MAANDVADDTLRPLMTPRWNQWIDAAGLGISPVYIRYDADDHALELYLSGAVNEERIVHYDPPDVALLLNEAGEVVGFRVEGARVSDDARK